MIISDSFTLDLGGVSVQIDFLGRGHTDGDLVAFVSPADVLFAGDLVEEAGPPVVDFDSFVGEWPGTLDQIAGRISSETVVVPGHGHVIDGAFVRAQRQQIAALSER